MLNEPVGTNSPEPELFKNEVFKAYDAEAIEPDIVISPVTAKLPVNTRLPDKFIGIL